MNSVQLSGWASIIAFRHILTPIAIDWVKYINGGYSVSWATLYIFGIRIARWRKDAP